MVEQVDTIVVGGGQAGLSTSWHLADSQREHLVLDRGALGDTWRNRWDSFCLVTPNRFCRLPGFPYPGQDPDGFMLRDEIVEYVKDYAASFNPPLRNGVEVQRISRPGGGDCFRLETCKADLEARNVIIATGTHQHPVYPSWRNRLAAELTQLHTRDYVSPEQLPAGAVLVVGSGQSGCQVAEDLRMAGREVFLCVGNAGRIPRRYRGKDIIQWAFDVGLMDLPVGEHPLGESIRFEPHEHLSGRDGGQTIDLRQMAIDGVRLLGRMTEADGFSAKFSGDLEARLDRIDKQCRETLDELDEYIAENSIDAPIDESEAVDWRPAKEVEALDLEQEGISTVIYATGFRYDFNWIDLPVFDDRGYPRYDRGITDLPGLYFIGLHWMHTGGSGLFSQVGRDAGYLVEQLNRMRS